MMDVQWHWTNLWWAGKRRNWPLAQYYIRPQIPTAQVQAIVNMDPSATWPQ
jgi:hypothetical protein